MAVVVSLAAFMEVPKKRGTRPSRVPLFKFRRSSFAGMTDVVLALGCRVGFAFELSVIAQEVQTRAVIG